MTGRGEPFIARPLHSTISACTLPIWLPEAVVKKGNQAFAFQLWQELIEMMFPSPDSLVESHKSSDSQDLQELTEHCYWCRFHQEDSFF